MTELLTAIRESVNFPFPLYPFTPLPLYPFTPLPFLGENYMAKKAAAQKKKPLRRVTANAPSLTINVSGGTTSIGVTKGAKVIGTLYLDESGLAFAVSRAKVMPRKVTWSQLRFTQDVIGE